MTQIIFYSSAPLQVENTLFTLIEKSIEKRSAAAAKVGGIYSNNKFKADFSPVPFDLIIIHLKPIEDSFLDKNFIIPLSSVLTVGNLISS